MMESWNQIINTALLGKDKRSFPEKFANEQCADATSHIKCLSIAELNEGKVFSRQLRKSFITPNGASPAQPDPSAIH
jgi:hypothetical protein